MKKLIVAGLLCFAASAYAESVSVNMYLTTTQKDQKPSYVGTVVAQDTHYGLMLTPDLKGLPKDIGPGPHGFHVHVGAKCGNDGMAAGGHLDPAKTNHHEGPYGNGHLGDLPVISVTAQGTATTPVVAPRLKVSDILGHTLMIHAGGDTYSDAPPLGGGGARMICGAIPTQAS